MGKTLIIFLMVWALLAVSNLTLAQDPPRYPFPAKPDAAKPEKPVKFPFPSRSAATVANTVNDSEILLAEEPVEYNRPASRKSSPAPKKKASSKPTKKNESSSSSTDSKAPGAGVSVSSVGTRASSGDVQLLRDQIQRLEEKILKMEEENEIRKQLESTDEEKDQKDEAILSTAGRAYTLMKPGRFGFEYSLRYTGDSADSISTSADDVVSVNHNAYHTLTNSFFLEYPVKENLTVNSNIPFVYKYNSQSNATAKDTTDLGDVTFGVQYQPLKTGKDVPSLILSGNLTCPTGRSPYKIDSSRELSTGNGVYSMGMGCNVSTSIDPLVAFGGINVDHPFKTTHLNYKTGTQGEAGIYLSAVDPGMVYSVSMGVGYSLSYKATLTLSYQYSYQSKTDYDWVGANDSTSEGSISSVFSVGTGWNLTPKRSVNVRLGIGLTNNDSDFSLQVRVPFTYEL